MAIPARHLEPADPAAKFLPPALILIGGVISVTLFIAALNGGWESSFPYFFTLPWIALLFVLLLLPTLMYYRRGELSLANPLMLATWSYFFPAFVIGGTLLATGMSSPYFLTFIQDPRSNLPYTVMIVIAGYLGLASGFLIPAGRRVGSWIQTRLPKVDFEPKDLIIPGIVLAILGFANSIIAFLSGVFGFQRSDAIEAYDGILSILTILWMQGAFVLFYIIFRMRKLTLLNSIALGIVVVTSIGRALMAGNRASFLQVFMVIMLAFLLAGRRLTAKQSVIGGFVLVICLMIGMIYGSTFRYLKGGESVVSASQYADSIANTFDYLSREGANNLLKAGFENLAERLDALSSLAVIVSNYEQLAPYEESYGLKDNIWNDLTTFFIPRIIWRDKPVAVDARRFSDLYFHHGENSFASTPMGDLLRNFGPLGVFVGMFILGVILRTLYRSLIEDQPRSLLRSAVYFLMLITVSYESFYGSILTYMVKVGFIAIAGVLLIYFVARATGKRPFPTYA